VTRHFAAIIISICLIFMSASVSAQDAGQILLGGRPLTAVTVSGNSSFSSNTILNLLPALQKGIPVDAKKLSAEVLAVNENPALKVFVTLQNDGADGVIAQVLVKDSKTETWLLSSDNTGTPETGNYRTSLAYINHDWLGSGQTAAFSLTGSPSMWSQVKEVAFYDAIPLPRTGDSLILNGSYSNVNSGMVANYFGIQGQGTAYGAHYQHVLSRTTTGKEGLDFGLDAHIFTNSINFFGSDLGGKVMTAPVSAGYFINETSPHSMVNAQLAYSRNLPSLSSTADLFATSRAGATANYGIWRMDGSMSWILKSGWMFVTSLDGQYANQPLVSGEQFFLGGGHSVRGFPEQTVSGDRGCRLSAELYTPEIAPLQRLVFFVDQGEYWLLNPQAGEVPQDYLASIGIGWRYQKPGGLSLAVDFAYVLNGTPTVTPHSTRVHFSITQEL